MRKFFVFMRRIFKKEDVKVEYYDTSFISNYFEEFKRRVNSPDIIAVVHIDVRSEIYKGVQAEKAKNRENLLSGKNFVKRDKCIKIWNFMAGNKNIKIKDSNLLDSFRVVDRRVINTVRRAYLLGVNAWLVTCDAEQAIIAEEKGLQVEQREVLPDPINRIFSMKPIQGETVINPVKSIKHEEQHVVPRTLPCIKQGKKYFVKLLSGMAIYDTRGKRKIPNNDLIEILPGERLTIREDKYKVSKITEKQVLLEGV